MRIYIVFCALLWLAPGSRADIDCATLIASDLQEPMTGTYGYQYRRSPKGDDERCEGRVKQKQGGGGEFYVEYFHSLDPSITRDKAEMLSVSGSGILEGSQGQVSILDLQQGYRADFLLRRSTVARWPFRQIAYPVNVDPTSLLIIGRISDSDSTVFFPVNISASQDALATATPANVKLFLSYPKALRYLEAFVGAWGQTKKCQNFREGPILPRVGPVPYKTRIPVNLSGVVGPHFCLRLYFQHYENTSDHPPQDLFFVQ